MQQLFKPKFNNLICIWYTNFNPKCNKSILIIIYQGRRSGPKSVLKGGGGRLGVGMNGGGRCVWQRVPKLIVKSAPVKCKADRLSAFCTSRAKMSAIRTRHDKTMLLVTKGDNGHFRTLRAITNKKILNKSNSMLTACLHLLATFRLECRAFACKKNIICQLSKVGGKRPPCPSPPLPVRRQCLCVLGRSRGRAA